MKSPTNSQITEEREDFDWTKTPTSLLPDYKREFPLNSLYSILRNQSVLDRISVLANSLHHRICDRTAHLHINQVFSEDDRKLLNQASKHSQMHGVLLALLEGDFRLRSLEKDEGMSSDSIWRALTIFMGHYRKTARFWVRTKEAQDASFELHDLLRHLMNQVRFSPVESKQAVQEKLSIILDDSAIEGQFNLIKQKMITTWAAECEELRKALWAKESEISHLKMLTEVQRRQAATLSKEKPKARFLEECLTQIKDLRTDLSAKNILIAQMTTEIDTVSRQYQDTINELKERFIFHASRTSQDGFSSNFGSQFGRQKNYSIEKGKGSPPKKIGKPRTSINIVCESDA